MEQNPTDRRSSIPTIETQTLSESNNTTTDGAWTLSLVRVSSLETSTLEGRSVEATSSTVPGYSGGSAACVVVSYSGFCSRGSLTPVAAPNVFLAGDGCVEVVSYPCLEGCGLRGEERMKDEEGGRRGRRRSRDVGALGVPRRATGCRRSAGSGEKLVILLDIWGVVAGQ